MKRIRLTARIALISIVTVALSSCSLMSPQTGKLTIPFPAAVLDSGSSAARELGAARSISTDQLGYVRVYLESMGGLIPIAGASTVFEASIPATNEITVDGLPQLRNCRLYLSLSVGGGADFRAVKYASSSDNFNIVAGGTATVSVTAEQSPFVDVFTRGDPRGVRALVVGNNSYFLAEGQLYAFAFDGSAWNPAGTLAIVGTSGITRANGLGPGKVMNSDGTFGADQLWISTDKGVWVLSGIGASMSIAQLPIGSGKTIGEVGSARAVTLKMNDGTLQNVMYYQGPYGLFGGAYSSGGAWTWFDLADNIDSLGPDVKAAITGSDKPVITDFAIDPGMGFGYLLVPAINNFRIGGDIVQTMKGVTNPDASSLMNAVLKDNTISLPTVAGLAPKATGIAEVNTSSGRILYIGTDRGLFTIGGIGSDGMITIGGSALPVSPVDLGKPVFVARIRATVYDGIVYTAVLGKGGTLFLLKNGSLAKVYPFYSGLPEFGGDAQATGRIFWTSQGLMIAGKNGVVRLNYNQLP